VGIFGPSKEEKQLQQQMKYKESIKKLAAALEEYYHLNLSSCDLNAMSSIAEDVNRVDILNRSAHLQNLTQNNAVENLKITYLSTLVQQNWLIIKKLTDISESINTSSNKAKNNIDTEDGLNNTNDKNSKVPTSRRKVPTSRRL
jgi:hypothetical protein